MTHFTVLVQIPKGEEEDIEGYIDNVLAPFDEKIQVAPYVDWSLEKARKKLAEEILKLRKIVESGDKERYNMDYCTKELQKLTGLTPEQYFQDRIKWYEKDQLDEDGNGLSTYNPNSKWDWYSIGGRWEGWLRLKSGKNSDVARVGDLDWEAYADEVKEERRKIWNELISTKKMAVNKAGRVIPNPENPAYPLELVHGIKNGSSLKDYLNEGITFSTFSVVTKNGVWQERAKMGWWAMTRDETESEEDWHEKFMERFIKPLDPDDWIALVDCHI